MSNIISISNFTGNYKIVTTDVNSSKQERLIENINTYERIILTDMLGYDLYKLFINDLVDGVPQSQRFIDIFGELCLNDMNLPSRYCYSISMKEILKRMIYFYHTREMPVQATSNGNVNHEVSISKIDTSIKAVISFNEAVNMYHVVQNYCKKNHLIYPEFKGTRAYYQSAI
jgi:ribosomal protein S16